MFKFPHVLPTLAYSILVACTASAQSWQGFPGVTYPGGSGAFSLLVRDLDGDALDDLVAVNSGLNNFMVLFDNGDGTYAPPVFFPAGDNPLDLIPGDFNEDGITDFATANYVASDLTVMLGQGTSGNWSGTFAAPVSYPAGAYCSALTQGDFNSDGITDVIVSTIVADSLRVFLGNGTGGVGDGTFTAGGSFPAGDLPTGLAVGDYNGDGIDDVAATNQVANTVSILMGNGTSGVGDATFAAPVAIAVGGSPQKIMAAEINGDLDTDLIVVNSSSYTVSVLTGNGDGTFATAASYPVAYGSLSVDLADFNEDGVTDIVTGNQLGSTVSILFGNGAPGAPDGTFAAAVTYPAGGGPAGVRALDSNRDGILDLGTLNQSDDNISIMLGKGVGGVGNGTFETLSSIPTGSGPYTVIAADFNEDSTPDVAIANYISGTVSVMLGAGDGAFSATVNYPTGFIPFGLVSADFTGDGMLDLATSNFGDDSVTVLPGNGSAGVGNGTFGAPIASATGNSPTGIATGLFNGDGIPDLVTAHRDSGSIHVLLGNGDGTFGAPTVYTAGTEPSRVYTASLNGDAFTDIVVPNNGDDNVGVYLGNGDGTFDAAVVYTVGDGPQSLGTGDFNEDGDTDLAVANWDGATVSLLIGNGDGTFAPQVVYTTGQNPIGVTAADYDHDGIPDLAVINMFSGTFSLHRGQGSGGVGNGTFAPQSQFLTRRIGSGITSADFDRDGSPDLATISQFDNAAQIILNLAAPVIDSAPTPLLFGAHEMGAPAISLDTTLDNIGVVDLITTATLTNDGGGAFTITLPPTTPVPSGGSTTFEVSFAPLALGLTTGTLALETNTTEGTIVIPLSGTGIDTQDPSSAATAPTGTLDQPSPIISLSYTATDTTGGSGVAGVELFHQRNGGGFVSGGVYTNSPISFDTTSLGGDGTYEFYTVATDNAGNAESAPGTADISVNFNDTTQVEEWRSLNE